MTQITNYSCRQRTRFGGCRRRLGTALIAVAISVVTHASFAATAEQITARAPVPALNVKDGVAVKGYDPVAYFNDGKPVKGSPEHIFKWQGATWQFVSEEHRSASIAVARNDGLLDYAPTSTANGIKLLQNAGLICSGVKARGDNHRALVTMTRWNFLHSYRHRNGAKLPIKSC